MKLITYRMVLAFFALGLCSGGLAQQNQAYARISLVGPSSGKSSVTPDEFIILVIEGSTLSYDTSPIPAGDTVDFVNKLLKEKGASYIGVYTREGTKFGQVVQALDALRKTDAKNIGLSMAQLK